MLAFVSPYAVKFLIAILGAYLVVGYCFSARIGKESGPGMILVLPLGTFCFHVAYGAGTLLGLRHLFWKPDASPIRPGLPVQE